MRFLRLTRKTLLSAALLLCAQAVFANYPSARTAPGMFYDPTTSQTILFGGQTAVDAGTKVAYDLNETWSWNGTEWREIYTAAAPSGRSAFGLAYDSKRARGVLFGGLTRTEKLNDTWVYSNGQWSQVTPATSPSNRAHPGMAYDPVRDRVVLFGGDMFATGSTTVDAPIYDTWEFDGTNWTQRTGTEPQVSRSRLVWDAARGQMLLIGANPVDNKFLMYRYNSDDGSWTSIAPATIPPCGNLVAAAFNGATGDVLVAGGFCNDTSVVSTATYRWDGSNWSTLDVGTTIYGSIYDAGFTYDAARQQMVLYGGTIPFGAPSGLSYTLNSDGWSQVATDGASTPAPRSLIAMQTDPVNGVIWMTGGFNTEGVFDALWKYSNGSWSTVDQGSNGPSGCASPVSAFDTDRNRLVLVCDGVSLFEWNGQAWTSFSGLKTAPPARRFTSIAYDPNLKKTVVFGGWDDSNYLDETWEWDGTQWTRIRKNTAPPRTLASMWYDPIRKKIVMFGGLGRETNDGRLTRFNDMWEFNGTNGWSEVKPATAPPARYGAQVAVDPRTGHAILFGGLLYTTTLVEKLTVGSQAYGNDTWEWDGTTWKAVLTATAPRPRENGGMAFDPQSNKLVMFGGYAGLYYGETWAYDAGAWTLVSQPAAPVAPTSVVPSRRRVTVH
jgi:hypothetical protein